MGLVLQASLLARGKQLVLAQAVQVKAPEAMAWLGWSQLVSLLE